MFADCRYLIGNKRLFDLDMYDNDIKIRRYEEFEDEEISSIIENYIEYIEDNKTKKTFINALNKVENKESFERFCTFMINSISNFFSYNSDEGKSFELLLNLVIWEPQLIVEERMEMTYEGEPYPVTDEYWEREAIDGDDLRIKIRC